MSAVIRIKRKRHQDPESSLVLSFKRSRPSNYDSNDPDVILHSSFSLESTAEATEADTQRVLHSLAGQKRKVHFADASVQKHSKLLVKDLGTVEMPDADGETTDPQLAELPGLCDAACAPEPDGSAEEASKPSISCNGVPMVRVDVAAKSDQDYVYDFYVAKAEMDENYFDGLIGGHMGAGELVPDEEQESEGEEDEDDENDENNWRNDYPDEESRDENDETDSDAPSDGDFETMVDGMGAMSFRWTGRGMQRVAPGDNNHPEFGDSDGDSDQF